MCQRAHVAVPPLRSIMTLSRGSASARSGHCSWDDVSQTKAPETFVKITTKPNKTDSAKAASHATLTTGKDGPLAPRSTGTENGSTLKGTTVGRSANRISSAIGQWRIACASGASCVKKDPVGVADERDRGPELQPRLEQQPQRTHQEVSPGRNAATNHADT